ncbi:hypothetical protein UlMin_042066 [Ulmus minor]
MVKIIVELVLVAFFLMRCGSHVRSNSIDHRYKALDPVPFYANKVGPYNNPSETYQYYDLPFCRPDHIKDKKQTLGEVLNGDHLIDAPYRLEFQVEKDFEVACRKNLTKEEVSQFRSAIKRDFYIQMYYDDLPIWSFLGSVSMERKANVDSNRYLLHNHILFEILFNKDSVVEINVRSESLQMIDLTEDKELYVEFSYTAHWKNIDSPFETRMERYSESSMLPHHLEFHWFSIMNSCITLLFLSGFLLRCYMRVLKKDLTGSLQDEKLPINQEERGWKSIQDYVFTYPANRSLLAAALGSGSQLFSLTLLILLLGLFGTFYPYNRGRLLVALVVIYTITSCIAGYTSTWFYCQLEGSNWLGNLLLTGCLFFGPLLFTFGILNRIATTYKTTSALPFSTIVELAFIWTLLALPLLLLGGIIGKQSKVESQACFHAQKCAREIPPFRWYRHALPHMALAGLLPGSVIYVEVYYLLATVWGYRIFVLYGILFIIFILLLITTAIVTVIFTCYQLVAEDYQWWWRSFLCGGSVGFYLFGYSIYYYHSRSNFSGTLQISFFFGYMACISYGIFLMLGTVGFLASWLFVRRIYSSL